MKRSLIPLALLAGLLAILAAGLRHDPRALSSALVGKPAPDFNLPLLDVSGESMSSRAMLGQVWILNVWASWCEPCRDEQPVLADFAARHIAPVLGLNYKDDRQNATRWLKEAGDPYTASIVDRTGETAIDYGVYGVPETFVIDRSGIVRYRLPGPLTRSSVDTVIVPLIGKLQREAGHD